MSGVSFHPAMGAVYETKQTYDLGHFVARLHDPELPIIVEHVRTISLNTPHDTMVSSGITNYLDGKPQFHSLSIYTR
jgi:hypothetical protein